MVTTLLPRITTMPSSFFSDADTCVGIIVKNWCEHSRGRWCERRPGPDLLLGVIEHKVHELVETAQRACEAHRALAQHLPAVGRAGGAPVMCRLPLSLIANFLSM